MKLIHINIVCTHIALTRIILVKLLAISLDLCTVCFVLFSFDSLIVKLEHVFDIVQEPLLFLRLNFHDRVRLLLRQSFIRQLVTEFKIVSTLAQLRIRSHNRLLQRPQISIKAATDAAVHLFLTDPRQDAVVDPVSSQGGRSLVALE
jgi:hypothetical protein